jgi:hypothetical protein
LEHVHKSDMARRSDILLSIFEGASSDWDGWDTVVVDKKGKVKTRPKGRPTKRKPTDVIITDPNGEA